MIVIHDQNLVVEQQNAMARSLVLFRANESCESVFPKTGVVSLCLARTYRRLIVHAYTLSRQSRPTSRAGTIADKLYVRWIKHDGRTLPFQRFHEYLRSTRYWNMTSHGT